ncbi:MAG: GGDEF domain-containing protein [Pseudomonadales bacterium]|nr:GGDEF domain-containing protein [Pseudomonadales bacterium]
MRGRYLWVGVLGWLCAWSQASILLPQAHGPYTFWPDQESIWRDTTERATLQDAERALSPHQHQFFKQVFWQPAVVWWHVRVVVLSVQPGYRYLEVVTDVRDNLDIYVLDPAGNMKSQWHGGANDRYGHQRGDEILMNLTRIMGGQLRRATDRLFRLGGEEFGLLLEIDHGIKARDFVDQLRQSIQDAGFEHIGSPLGCVTVSIGVLHLSATAGVVTPEELYAATDALLYVAKARGRNTIEAQWR